MTHINIQVHFVSRSKVSVEGQAYALYVWEGGISVSQTSIFNIVIYAMEVIVPLLSLYSFAL